jgi:hypothetical protein
MQWSITSNHSMTGSRRRTKSTASVGSESQAQRIALGGFFGFIPAVCAKRHIMSRLIREQDVFADLSQMIDFIVETLDAGV